MALIELGPECENYFAVTTGMGQIVELVPRALIRHSEFKADIRAGEVIAKVAEAFNVPVEFIHSKRRDQHTAFVRQVAMYLVREVVEMKSGTAMSYPAIGEAFGRDHSTVIHAHNRVIGKRMAAEPAFRAQIERLRDSL